MDTLNSHNMQIGVEAGEWLLRLRDTELDPSDPYSDPVRRDRAFVKWLARSPEHVKVFMETREIYERLGSIDQGGSIKIDQLLEDSRANVVQLLAPRRLRRRIRNKPYLAVASVAAAILLSFGTLISWKLLQGSECATVIGEQRTCKLADGSVVYLNADSRIRVAFSSRERHIDLLRGEALFAVEHDANRPFVVDTGHASILAVGTAFNVRRRHQETDVTVVEGTVQVSDLAPKAITAPSPSVLPLNPTALVSILTSEPVKLTAGEEAQVSRGRVNKQVNANISDALSWRQRRLVFRNTPLGEVAEEFNHYNAMQITVQGGAARRMELTGVFDADRPTTLILYALKQDSLAVEHEGNNWVIRERTVSE